MQQVKFIPAGYLYKKITEKPAWLNADIEDICSVSNCISEDFTNYINYWQHNGYWLFDKPNVMSGIASEQDINLSEMQLFYYEVYELEFIETNDGSNWCLFEAEPSFITNVAIPDNKSLKGFDVVTFFTGNAAECSPLSCNHIASEIKVNKHCLFNTFIEAKQALENGIFKHAEPGPYRIFAVYKIT